MENVSLSGVRGRAAGCGRPPLGFAVRADAATAIAPGGPSARQRRRSGVARTPPPVRGVAPFRAPDASLGRP